MTVLLFFSGGAVLTNMVRGGGVYKTSYVRDENNSEKAHTGWMV